MTLTDQQIEAVKTWRKGLNDVIVADVPFVETDKPMSESGQTMYGGKYHVAAYVSDEVMDFILAATREMATRPPPPATLPLDDFTRSGKSEPAAVSVSAGPLEVLRARIRELASSVGLEVAHKALGGVGLAGLTEVAICGDADQLEVAVEALEHVQSAQVQADRVQAKGKGKGKAPAPAPGKLPLEGDHQEKGK